MPQRPREVLEGPQCQGKDERIRYHLDVGQWAFWPTDLSAKIYTIAGTDVTDTKMSGTCYLVDATTIALPYISHLTAGEQYRVEVKFTEGGNTYEAFFIIQAEE
jgi:hypothetical protein